MKSSLFFEFYHLPFATYVSLTDNNLQMENRIETRRDAKEENIKNKENKKLSKPPIWEREASPNGRCFG